MIECHKLGGCMTGQAKTDQWLSTSGKICHPHSGPCGTAESTRSASYCSCYHSCFAVAHEHNLKTLAFPAISCGIYHFPLHLAVEIAMRETHAELTRSDAIHKVIFACFGEEIYTAYQRLNNATPY